MHHVAMQLCIFTDQALNGRSSQIGNLTLKTQQSTQWSSWTSLPRKNEPMPRRSSAIDSVASTGTRSRSERSRHDSSMRPHRALTYVRALYLNLLFNSDIPHVPGRTLLI